MSRLSCWVALLSLIHCFWRQTLLECIRYLACKLDDGWSGFAKNVPLPPHEQRDTADARQEHRIISRRRRDAEIMQPLIRATFKSIAAQILRLSIPATLAPVLDDGNLMLRAVLPYSATRHDAELGFICGNAHLAAPDFHSETLKSSPYMRTKE